MKKKLALIVLGLVVIGAAYFLGMPWWSYGFGVLTTLIGIAWLGVYDNQPSRDSYEKLGDSSRHGGGDGGGL